MPMDAQFECLVGTASLGKDKVLQEGPTSTLRYGSCYSGSSVTVELSIRPAAGASTTCCCCNPASVLRYLHHHLQRMGVPNQGTDLIRKQKKPANKNIKREVCLRSRAQITASAPPAQPTPGAAMLPGKRYGADGTTAAKLLLRETLNLIKCRKFKTNLCLLDGQGQPSFLAKARTSIKKKKRNSTVQVPALSAETTET